MDQDRPQDQTGSPPEPTGSPPEPTEGPDAAAPEPAGPEPPAPATPPVTPPPPATPPDAAPPAAGWQQPAAPPPTAQASTGWDAPPAAPPAAPTETGWSAPPPAPPQGQAPMSWAPELPAQGGVFVRTGAVSAAAWILVILGILGLLFGALTVLVGSFFNRGSELIGQDPEVEQVLPIFEAFAGVIAVIGVIVMLYSLAYIAAGWGGYRGRPWARVLGIIIAVIGVLVWLPGMAGGGNSNSGIVFALVILACHAWVLFAYAARWRRA